MNLASLLTAATDRSLHRGDLAVLLFLHAHLDYETYRPLKQSWLARSAHLPQGNVSRSLKKLVAGGYCVPRPIEGYCHRLEYRLPLSLLPTAPVGVVLPDKVE
jgi:DNA-binding MarR family transcriptional regulator